MSNSPQCLNSYLQFKESLMPIELKKVVLNNLLDAWEIPTAIIISQSRRIATDCFLTIEEGETILETLTTTGDASLEEADKIRQMMSNLGLFENRLELFKRVVELAEEAKGQYDLNDYTFKICEGNPGCTPLKHGAIFDNSAKQYLGEDILTFYNAIDTINHFVGRLRFSTGQAAVLLKEVMMEDIALNKEESERRYRALSKEVRNSHEELFYKKNN